MNTLSLSSSLSSSSSFTFTLFFSLFLSFLTISFTLPTQVYVGLSNSTIPFSLTPKESLVSGDQFGHSVAIWDNICIISATKRGIITNEGRVDADGVVFVFQQNEYRQWEDSEIILASYLPDDGFGESLSLYLTTAVIGAPKDDTLGTNTGYVYIFYTTSSSALFGNIQQIYSDKPEDNDYFGYSVAIIPGVGYYSHGAVIIGAYGHNRDNRIVDSGTVFIFANSGNNWYQATVIQSSQPYTNGYFGYSVSGYGNVIAIGAPGQEAVYVYHLEGIEHECPHEGVPEQMPSACQNQDHPHRLLQGAPGNELNQDQRAHTYSTWEYVEILHVQNDIQYYKGDQFGSSVAIINDTSLMLAVGSPKDNDGGKEAGAVIIMCLLSAGDIWSSWSPDGDTVHHSNDVQLNHRSLQGGGGGGAGAGAVKDDAHQQNIWKIRSSEYTTDKDGSYWMLMSKKLGTYGGEMYGYRTAISDNHIIVGTNVGANGRGRAELLVLNETETLNVQSPVYKGALYHKDWLFEANLFDHQGGVGDYFGTAIAIHEDTAIVGGYLTGYKGTFALGTGGAYVYDAIRVYGIPVTKSTSVSSTNSSGFMGNAGSFLSFALFIVVIFVVGGYVAIQASKWSGESTNSAPSMVLPVWNSTKTENAMDISTSSVDTDDMNSRHPLQTRIRDNTNTSRPKPYQDNSPKPTAVLSPAPAGKYRDLQARSDSQDDSSDDIPSTSRSNNQNKKPTKTSKYMQPSGGASTYGASGARIHTAPTNRQGDVVDSDSDGDPTPAPRSNTTSTQRVNRY